MYLHATALPHDREGTMNRINLRRILCPIDFSSLSRILLASASAIARVRKAELRALHVVPSEGVTAPASLGSLDHQAVMSQLRKSLAEAAPGYDRVGAAARQGDPATQILRFARTMPADLIVIGAPGVDRPERPMGPVASVVVARSECPVLTVPSHRATSSIKAGLFKRIVCAVDLAPSSRGVMRQALSLAWETQGHLTFVCTLAKDAPIAVPEARKRLLGAMPADASDWCETEVVVTKGVASTQIVRVAEKVKADIVVIGAPRRWTSTTHAVLGRSLCPVLVTHDARPLTRPT
jgi:nucleotide-binding universal stress UspA family protein